jgi:hypothetical protein
MLELIEQAAGKEAERENKKLAKRVRINDTHFPSHLHVCI